MLRGGRAHLKLPRHARGSPRRRKRLLIPQREVLPYLRQCHISTPGCHVRGHRSTLRRPRRAAACQTSGFCSGREPSVRTACSLQPQEAPLLSLTWIETLLRLEISVKTALCASSLLNSAKGVSATPRAARILAFRSGSPEAERSCSRTDAASRAPCAADGWSAHGQLPVRLRAAEEPSLLRTKSCCSAVSTSQHSCC